MAAKKTERRVPPFFNAKLVAQSLKQVNVDFIKTEYSKVTSKWFHGIDDADVFVWTDERNNIIKQQVAFCGQVVEWNVLDGVKTGVILQEEMGEKKMSEIVKFDQVPQKGAIGMAKELLSHLECVEIEVKDELVQLLTRPFQQLSPEDVIKKYGFPSGASFRPSIWSQFRHSMRKIFS